MIRAVNRGLQHDLDKSSTAYDLLTFNPKFGLTQAQVCGARGVKAAGIGGREARSQRAAPPSPHPRVLKGGVAGGPNGSGAGTGGRTRG